MDENLMGRVAEPELCVGDWVNQGPGIREAKVSSGLKYPPKRRTVDKILQTPKKYAIRPNRTIEDVAHRSYKDFAALREALVGNFPGAFVPTLPKSRTKSAMNLFMLNILANPFFRNSGPLELFLDHDVNYYASTLKKRRKTQEFLLSEGSIRWQQAMEGYENRFDRNFVENQGFFTLLKAELKTLLKHLDRKSVV